MWKLINAAQESHADCCCDKIVKADFYFIWGWY